MTHYYFFYYGYPVSQAALFALFLFYFTSTHTVVFCGTFSPLLWNVCDQFSIRLYSYWLQTA